MGMGLHYSPFLLLIVQLLKLTWQMDMLSFLLPCVCIDLREGMVMGVRGAKFNKKESIGAA